MILRRITEHVKAQNWLAVALDFLIVVIGVFIGIQVSNWNDGRRVEALEQSYLTRLADDLNDNIKRFDAEIEFSSASRDHLIGFLEAVKYPATTDADLVGHTQNYLTDGAFLAKLDVTDATFNDLQSTGNLDILRDRELREALVELYASYARGAEVFKGNRDWVLLADSQIYMEVDAFRFDQRTAPFFPENNIADSAQYIRTHQDMLRRHAAMHFWLKDRAVEILQDMTEQTKTVLSQLEGAQ